MANNQVSVLNLASDMQLRTRKAKEFERFESSLAEAKSSKVPLAQGQPKLTRWLANCNIFRPFAKPVTDNETVWLLDNTAFKSSGAGPWKAEFVAAVFEREDKQKLVDVVSGVLRAVGLTEDASERRTVEERLLPFLWDVCPGRTITVAQQATTLKLGPSNTNGITSKIKNVPESELGSLVTSSTKLGGGPGSVTNMQTYYSGEDGWGIISAGLLSALTVGTEEYKVDRMKKIHEWLPKRKMIAIGDSTQSDPEAYGEMYRTWPNWIHLILIRKATEIAEIGIKEKNEPERFEKAFKDVPRGAWHVFEDPAECLDIVKRAVKEDQ
ncbi:hypothetical protein E4U41_004943 [Claviceps citrina]|nr:hypothetical protein E4U41_004943 [Claviceps citrina]